ncbi:hypothetical protein PYW07_014996 [Mythimna separata]|uniref:Uncharacterized protein n=1 Tax=Mythimna separata TaxID=271217 RepID=A0AAD7YZ93_MYTSE|nr:hypothetical protein PYW07_014996 [Mythimna separata]
MESSSENSFAWTDTSSDSTSMAADDMNDNSNKNDEKETKDKKSRKKHGNLSVSLEPNAVIKEEKTYFETKSNSSVKKEPIKVEPDSDNDKRKKKKKIKNLEINGNHNDSQDSISYDESYLNMKVKQESSVSSSTKHKKKKKRKRSSSIDLSTAQLNSHENNSSSETYNDNVTLQEETEKDVEIRKIKKKKKSKKKYDSDTQIPEVEEKMDVDETVVNNYSKGKDSDSFVTDNTALQEENEESGGDEISVIKCNDSHTTHTLSFINKSIDEGQNFNKKLEAAKHRKQRLSDRIRFEDDDDDDDDTNIQSSHVNHASNSENNKKQLKQFLKNNPNLKQISQTYNNSLSVTQDDEIWVLKCPKEINIKDFDKTTLNIHGRCKIKVGGQSYEGSAEEEQSDTLSLLTMEQNKYKIRNIKLNGIINLRKRIPKAHFRDDNIMVNNQTNFIPLPETKCRHPLFGSNYKKALKIPAAIAERLNVQDTEDTLLRAAKRKKKKKLKETNTAQQDDPQVDINDITMKTEPEFLEVREKKKKKRKLMDDEGPAPKKVKRIKHDPESAEAWESEKAIEENLFNF